MGDAALSYYTRLYDFLAGATVRSQEFDDEFNAIQSGFSAVETRLQAAIQTPENTTQTLPAAASRINKILSFDASGNAVATASLTGAFSFSGTVSCADPTAASHAATKAWVETLALSAAIPVTGGDAGKYLTNNGSTLQWGVGIPSLTGNAGKLMGVNPAGDGTEWVGLPFSSIQIFTSTGTFTPDPRRNKYFVIAIGGGGGGYNTAAASGWGGDSVLGIMTIDAAQTVTIGAGGTGGESPTAGGDTAIGTLLVAKGGPIAPIVSPATGGTTPSGCVRIQGGRTGSYYSSGSTGGTLLHTSMVANSNVTTLPQDGHGGASTSSDYGQRDGGAGIVIIMW